MEYAWESHTPLHTLLIFFLYVDYCMTAVTSELPFKHDIYCLTILHMYLCFFSDAVILIHQGEDIGKGLYIIVMHVYMLRSLYKYVQPSCYHSKR